MRFMLSAACTRTNTSEVSFPFWHKNKPPECAFLLIDSRTVMGRKVGVGEAPLKSRINIDKRAQSFTMTSDELFAVASIFVGASVSRNPIDLSRKHKVRAIQSIGIAFAAEETRCCWQSFLFREFISLRTASLSPHGFRAPFFPAEKIANKSRLFFVVASVVDSGIDDLVRVNILWGRTKKGSIENEIPLSPQKTCFNLLIFDCDCVFTVFPIPQKKFR